MSNQLGAAALALLRAAVDAPNATQETVAQKIGVGRSSVSLALSGKYPANAAKLEQKVVEALGRFTCPHLAEEISNKQCISFHTREAPTSSPYAMRHWRACQTCPHRRNV